MDNEEILKISDCTKNLLSQIDFEKENQRISENKEIDTNEFDDEKFDLECPRCGFRWNDE